MHNFAYYGSFGGGAPFRDIIDAGVTAGAGSDGRAIGPLDPWQGIHYMVTGRTIASSLVNDGQQITRLEALRLYTMGSAWTALEEDQLGSIEVGKLADLVILNADFLTLPEDEIDDIAAVLTFVGGVLVYDDGTLSAANDDNASSASIAGEAAAFTLLEWNTTGGQVTGNRSLVQDIFATEDANIIVLQETGRGAATIAEILGDDYMLVVATRGQDIWVKDDGRFRVTATDLFDAGCDGFDLATASVTLEDTRSDGRLLHLYSSHFCVPDSFGGAFGAAVDSFPDIANEEQQEHLCSLISGMEEQASSGTVLLAADFNDIGLADGESLVAFLEGSGTLNAGYCESTAIAMIEVVVTDVSRIMGTGKADMYADQRTVSNADVGFGQHGYVVTAVTLRLAE